MPSVNAGPFQVPEPQILTGKENGDYNNGVYVGDILGIIYGIMEKKMETTLHTLKPLKPDLQPTHR